MTFNLFYLSYFMSGGGPFGRTELFVTEAYKLVNDFQLYGVAAAFSVLHVLPAARDHPCHQPHGESDRELCGVTLDALASAREARP